MKRIDFDIKYRPQIESGEYKVETKNGHPVRIICWDTGLEWPICALVKDHNSKSTYGFPDLFDEKGKCIDSKACDLLIITNKSENMTEEIITILKQVKDLCNETSGRNHVWFDKAISWLEKQGEQKPAEWSEDDQSNFNELSGFILETYRAEDASRLITWFKSLKERIQPDKGWIPIKESFYVNNVVLAQKKDKSDVWEGYTVIADHTLDPLVFERYINIENISTQSLWKPSDEMLEALYRVIPENVMEKSEDEMLLDKLYQGLKYGKVKW